jgi:uncharacterized membrane protein YbhN (UPF0104 family)
MAFVPQPANSDESRTGVQGDARRLRNGLIWTAVLLAMLLGIGLAVPDLRSVIDRASDAGVGWLAAGAALEVASCLGYVAVMRLVLPRAPARDVRRLAWAEQAFGAVVPVGGAGGLAVGAWAMRNWGVPWSRIANRSAVIFLVTSAVNALVLGLAGFGVVFGLGHGHVHDTLIYGLIPTVIAFGGLAFFMSLPWLIKPDRAERGRLGAALWRLATWVRDSETIAFTPDWRLIGAVGYLVFDIAVLWACLRAVGVTAPVPALVVGYQIGYLANLLPVPGGVGVLEGGLLGALLLYGLPAAPTAAAVVLYHAIALWVPTLGGTYGFARLRSALATARRPVLKVIHSPAPASDFGDLAA